MIRIHPCMNNYLLGWTWASPTLIVTTAHVTGNLCMHVARGRERPLHKCATQKSAQGCQFVDMKKKASLEWKGDGNALLASIEKTQNTLYSCITVTNWYYSNNSYYVTAITQELKLQFKGTVTNTYQYVSKLCVIPYQINSYTRLTTCMYTHTHWLVSGWDVFGFLAGGELTWASSLASSGWLVPNNFRSIMTIDVITWQNTTRVAVYYSYLMDFWSFFVCGLLIAICKQASKKISNEIKWM